MYSVPVCLFAVRIRFVSLLLKNIGHKKNCVCRFVISMGRTDLILEVIG